jgi:hypothetical protein
MMVVVHVVGSYQVCIHFIYYRIIEKKRIDPAKTFLDISYIRNSECIIRKKSIVLYRSSTSKLEGVLLDLYPSPQKVTFWFYSKSNYLKSDQIFKEIC